MRHRTLASPEIAHMSREMAGFTLIELLTTLAVVALVAAFSVPAFSQIIERQRIEAIMRRLETDLALARHTAITRHQPVLLCPRNAHGQCQPGLDWSDGWLVLVGEIDTATAPLWGQPPLTDAGHGLMISANRPSVRYRHDGSSAGSNLTITLCLHGQVVAQQIVSNTGRARRHQPEGGMAC